MHFAYTASGKVHAFAQSYAKVTPVASQVHVPGSQVPFDPLQSHVIDLDVGDCVTYDPRMPHRVTAVGEEPAACLVITCPPVL